MTFWERPKRSSETVTCDVPGTTLKRWLTWPRPDVVPYSNQTSVWTLFGFTLAEIVTLEGWMFDALLVETDGVVLCAAARNGVARTSPLARAMAEQASTNKKLFLQEMAYRELKIIPEKMERPVKNGVAMGVSYVIGGAIPLLPYLISTNVAQAVPISIIITLASLFVLGSLTTRFSKRAWWKAGLEMLALASAAALIGYAVGQAAQRWLKI